LGAAILLGAMLAPTDPVLASDVQVQHAGDRDRVRFCLTSEAALNDGAAFPFVMLGLGLLGLHALGPHGTTWLAVDVLWASFGGLAIGASIGALVGRLILYLRIRHREAVGLDEFLTLGVIALSYGLALLLHAYGFLAVFAAGYAIQRITVLSTESNHNAQVSGSDEPETDPAKAPQHMASQVLGFNEQLERIGEVAVMLVVGALLSMVEWSWSKVGFVALLFVVVRPVSVAVGLFRTRTELTRRQRALIAWFGIRGLGSIYYLYFALKFPLPESIAKTLFDLTLIAVATSVVLHGISVTPLMLRYSRTREGRA
jgi:NhaP-type Na+/H+ or K+/H+ antiporter